MRADGSSTTATVIISQYGTKPAPDTTRFERVNKVKSARLTKPRRSSDFRPSPHPSPGFYCGAPKHAISGGTRSSLLDIAPSMTASLITTFRPISRTFAGLATESGDSSGLGCFLTACTEGCKVEKWRFTATLGLCPCFSWRPSPGRRALGRWNA